MIVSPTDGVIFYRNEQTGLESPIQDIKKALQSFSQKLMVQSGEGVDTYRQRVNFKWIFDVGEQRRSRHRIETSYVTMPCQSADELPMGLMLSHVAGQDAQLLGIALVVESCLASFKS